MEKPNLLHQFASYNCLFTLSGIFQRQLDTRSFLGDPVKNIIARGEFVPNKIVLDLIKSEIISMNGQTKPFIEQFTYYLDVLSKFSEWTIEKAKTNKDDVSAAANDYLKTLGYVSLAFAWVKVLNISFKDYEENRKFYDSKINTAKFYFDKVLPRAEQHYKSAISGSSNIMNFKFN